MAKGTKQREPRCATTSSPAALEQIIDGHAYAPRTDPIEFRLKKIPAATSARWGRVIDALRSIASNPAEGRCLDAFDGQPRQGPSVSLLPHVEALTGVVADVEVNKDDGKERRRITSMSWQGRRFLGIDPPGYSRTILIGSFSP